jgi:hypothetical protein
MRAAAWKGSLHLDSRAAESPGHGNWISLESLTERHGGAGSRPEVNAGGTSNRRDPDARHRRDAESITSPGRSGLTESYFTWLRWTMAS